MLMFRQSLDKGKTFGPSRILYRGDSLYSGRETIAAKGNYLFVTFPTSDGSLRLRRSEDGGATFKPTQVVSNEGGLWPEVQFAPDVPSGKTFYLFWDNPSFRRSVTGGATFDKVLWHHPVFTTGNYQRSQRVLTSGHKLHTLTSGQFYSASLCGGYCDRDVFYRSIFPAPSPGGAGSALRLYTETKPFEDRADNMQALSKTLDITGAFTAEIWVKDLGGGITTGYSDYHTPIFFKQRDLSQSYRPAYAIGTIASYGDRRIVADLETTEGSHRLTAQGDAGLLPANIWTHLALVYRPAAAADNLQLFKNGQLVAAATVTGKVVPGFGNLFVGRYGNWLVDELRIWGLPRSASELQTGMKGPLVGNETGLNAYFNFDGTTQDITGKGNHGLLMYKERYAAGRY
jgi:hypothetical protein